MNHLNKKISITILYVFTIVNLFGQTVFTHSEFSPQNGDTYTVGRVAPPPPGSAGANQIWDFSNLTISSTATYTVSDASSIQCSSDYPNATQAIGTGGNFAMINVNSTDYDLYGITLTPGTAGYVNSNPRKAFAFPMNYTNSFTDTYLGENASNEYQYGSTTVTYDAYGTLITPYTTYSNALRIHSNFTVADSTNNCTGTRDYYYWYVSGYRYPVAQIWSSTGNCSMASGSEFLQSVSVGAEEDIENSVMVIFPNPFSNQTTVQVKHSFQNATLVIYNTYGQSVKEMYNISGQTITISRDDLPKGIYFIHLIQDNKIEMIKKILITDL